ncbi:MAG: Uma2 family endonuclease [Thermoleophilaceae bacterium]
MGKAARMTADDYLALPARPDRRRLELVEGEVAVNEPAWLHNAVQSHLTGALWAWAHARAGRGAVGVPLDVRLDEHNVYAPDVVWYSEGRVPARHDPPPYPLPDLVAEIRSPSTWQLDLGAKKAAYERHGLPELWLLDTAAETVLAFRRSAPGGQTFDVTLELSAGDALGSPLLEGFAVALDELFA